MEEINIDDLNTYTFEIGSRSFIDSNPREYVIEKLEEAILHYLFDLDFYFNYLDRSDKKIYWNLFKRRVLKPFSHKDNINRTLNKYFTIDSNRKLINWKLSDRDSEKFRDEFKIEYYKYRLDHKKQ